MEYLNPLFKEQRIIKTPKETNKPHQHKKRKQRSDKTHNIKFPVSNIERMKLKSLCKKVKRILEEQGKDTIEQTKLNTLLFEYGLKNQHLINWELPYSDPREHYMHTNILESLYESEIGSPFGLAVLKGLSDRKIAYKVVTSILEWLEGEGSNIEKIL